MKTLGEVKAVKYIVINGTADGFLKADGSIDTTAYSNYTSSLGITLVGKDFRPDYGSGANQIAQGNDSRINNGQTAHGWGNHATQGYIKTFTDTTYVGSTTITLGAGNSFQRAALTGDVTSPANSNVTTIADNAVTSAKIATNAVTFVELTTIPTKTLIGRFATGTGDAQNITLGSNISIDATGVLNSVNTNNTYTGSTSISLSGISFQRAALTGDVTAALNDNTTTIAANAITTPKILNNAVTSEKIATNAVTFVELTTIPTKTLVGRFATGTGDAQNITLGSNLSIDATGVLNSINTAYTGSTSIGLVAGSFQRAALTGDVTSPVNSNVTTIGTSTVNFNKLQNINTQRLLGRGTAGVGDIQELTLGSNLTLSAAGVLSSSDTTYTLAGLGGLPLTGGIMTGVIDLNRNNGGANTGLAWWTGTYKAWRTYMSTVGAGQGPVGITPPVGQLVTTYALRNYVEDTAGYGWTFEAGAAQSTTPTIKAEIRSSDGAARFGSISVYGGTSSGFLKANGTIDTTGYMSTSHPANTITTANINNWDTASSYGDHRSIYPLRATLGASTNSIRVLDTRSINPLPTTDLKFGAWFDFKTSSVIGLNGAGLYAGVMTVVPYGDDSGNNGAAFRLAQSNNGLYFQNYASGGWGTMNKLWDNSNFLPTDFLDKVSSNIIQDPDNWEIRTSTEGGKGLRMPSEGYFKFHSDYPTMGWYSSRLYMSDEYLLYLENAGIDQTGHAYNRFEGSLDTKGSLTLRAPLYSNTMDISVLDSSLLVTKGGNELLKANDYGLSIGPESSRIIFSNNLLNANRTYQMPDKSGTVALLSDISTGYMSTTHVANAITAANITSWNDKFKSLKNVANLDVVSESGIYRQEGPANAYSFSATLNLNSSDGRAQLMMNRAGSGMKYRTSTSATTGTSWTPWITVFDTSNLNPQLFLNKNTDNIVDASTFKISNNISPTDGKFSFIGDYPTMSYGNGNAMVTDEYKFEIDNLTITQYSTNGSNSFNRDTYFLNDSAILFQSGIGKNTSTLRIENLNASLNASLNTQTFLSINPAQINLGYPGSKATISQDNINADRLYELPDQSGTIALLSDIPTIGNFVTVDTAQTISGTKTFSGQAIFQGNENNNVEIFKTVTGIDQVASGLVTKWYANAWKVGIKRDGSANSVGYAFWFSTDSGSTYSEKALIRNDGYFTGTGFIKSGGSATQVLMADGSVKEQTTFGGGNSNFLNVNTQLTYGASGLNYFNIAGIAGNNPAINQAPTNAWHHIIRMNHSNSGGYYADLAVSMVDNSGISRRVINNGVAISDWVKIWDSSHFTQTNVDNWNTAVGWGSHAGKYSLINHSHTFASITGKPTTISGYGITDAIKINNSSGLNIHSGAGNTYNAASNNSTWFDYNWAGTGIAGSVINFSGLSNAYATEIFGNYSDGSYLGFRTRNGDNNTWNPARKIWHEGNFNPDGKANAMENATGIGLSSGGNPNASNAAYPYFFSIYGYITLATRKWVEESMVTLTTVQTITGAKTFSSALTAQSFVKTGGTANDILMANGTTILKSSITGTTYATGTLAEINAGTNATRVWTPLVLRDSLVTLGTAQTITGVKTFSGSITAPSFLEGSLRSLKTNIKPFEKSGLELVNELEIVTFDRKDKSVKNKIGIIADDSSKEFLSEEQDSVDLYKTVFIQAKAIQELIEENKKLKEELHNLRELVMSKLDKL